MEAIGSQSSRTTTRSSSGPKRKPFADLTNASSLLSAKPKPKLVAESDQRPAPSLTLRRRRDGEAPTNPPVTPKSKEFAASSAKDAGYNAELENSADTGEQFRTRRKGKENDELENSTASREQVRTRRKGKGKVAEAVSTLSCPPLGRIRSVERSVQLEEHVASLREAFSVPFAKKKRRKIDRPVLPRDFVEKQRAYFAEVDAFELPVEEVSDSELE